MTTAIAWIYLIWQAWRVAKKLLGFSNKSWDEVFAPTIILATLTVFGLVLGFMLMVFVGICLAIV